MSHPAASPMSTLAANKENSKGSAPRNSSGAGAGVVHKPPLTSTTAAAAAAQVTGFPSIQLNQQVVAIIEENEDMLRVIHTLRAEKKALKARVELTEKLEAEVVELRARLGYVTADTTSTRYKAMDYKKRCEELEAVVARMEADLAENKEVYEGARRVYATGGTGLNTAPGGGGGGGGGNHNSNGRDELSIANLREETVSIRRMPNVAADAVRKAFQQLRTGKPTAITTAAARAELMEKVTSSVKRCAVLLGQVDPAEMKEGGLRKEVLVPIAEWALQLVDLSCEILDAYAVEKLTGK